jgi:hypothetical protein
LISGRCRGPGVYRVGEREVRIGAQLAQAVAGTRLYEPGDAVAGPATSSISPTVTVTYFLTLGRRSGALPRYWEIDHRR